jgi:hypothetical protein
MVGVLLDQEDRHAFLAYVRPIASKIRARRGATRGRLVEQQEPRPAHQGAADCQHLLLAARQRAAALLAPLGEAREHGEHALEVVLEVRRAGDGGTHLQVLVDAHAREDAPALRHLRHAAPDDLLRR